MGPKQAYLFARLMWNPDYDVQKGIEEFCRDCYGAAVPYVLAFVKLVNDADTYTGTLTLHYPNMKLTGFHCPGGAMVPIRKDKLPEMDGLFDAAEQAVGDDPGALERVRLARLAAQYSIMLYADKNDPLREKAMRDFFPLAAQCGITKLRLPDTGREFRNDGTDEYRREVTMDEFRTFLR